MKKTNLLPLTVCVFMLVSGGTTFAGSCKAIEFAELQSLNKKELTWAFCSTKIEAGFNANRFEASLKNASDFNGMGARAEAKEQIEKGDAYKKDLDFCRDEVERIGRVMDKKGIKKPSCGE